jgi:hypothetical protein
LLLVDALSSQAAPAALRNEPEAHPDSGQEEAEMLLEKKAERTDPRRDGRLREGKDFALVSKAYRASEVSRKPSADRTTEPDED